MPNEAFPFPAIEGGRASKYNRPINSLDFENAHSIGIMAVPPGSFVLDVGAADGSVARALTERGCRVWAIEVDPAAAQAAEEVCERVFCADITHVDLEDVLRGHRFDVVLLLDVLEHLPDPQAILSKLVPFVNPGGRFVVSIPNVTHASVRLQLLRGKFTRTETGLLDSTHLHFFDRAEMRSLFRRASLLITDELRVRRRLTETEINVDVSSLPKEVVEAATADFDAHTYQFVLIATPSTTEAARSDSLAEWLQHRADTLEQTYHDLERYARNLERLSEEQRSQLDRATDRAASAEAALQAERTEHLQVRTALEVESGQRLSAASADQHGAREHARVLEGHLRDATKNLEGAHRLAAHLRRDLALKEAYIAELRLGQERLQREHQSALKEIGALRGQVVAECGARDACIAELRLAQEGLLGEIAVSRLAQEGLLGEIAALRLAQEGLLGEIAASRLAQEGLLGDIAASRLVREGLLGEIAASRLAQQSLLDAIAESRLAQECSMRERTAAVNDLNLFRQQVAKAPRYWVVDRLNNAVRQWPALHRILKRTFVAVARPPQ